MTVTAFLKKTVINWVLLICVWSQLARNFQ
jgi:hypothetical protein